MATEAAQLYLQKKIEWQVTLGGENAIHEDHDETKPEIGRRRFQRVKDYFATALEMAAKKTGVDIMTVPAGQKSLIFPKDSSMSTVREGQAEVILFDGTPTNPFRNNEKIQETYSKAIEIVKGITVVST